MSVGFPKNPENLDSRFSAIPAAYCALCIRWWALFFVGRICKRFQIFSQFYSGGIIVFVDIPYFLKNRI